MQKEELIRNLRNYKFPETIIQAFEKVEREKFIPEENRRQAYEDIPLPIGYGATISQPYTIAFMLKHLKVKDRQKILEVGSGSGYALALLSELSPNGKIFGIERIKELVESSQEKLKDYSNVKIIYGDGSKGLPEEAPLERILVSAASDKVPKKLVEQLDLNGIMVIPIRNSIVVLTKTKEGNKIEEYSGFRFVPLIEE
jgi:protein-L-isoaspartate(D-aspartate) O-methyltransferase